MVIYIYIAQSYIATLIILNNSSCNAALYFTNTIFFYFLYLTFQLSKISTSSKLDSHITVNLEENDSSN